MYVLILRGGLEIFLEEAIDHKAQVPSETNFLDTHILVGDMHKQQFLLEDNIMKGKSLNSKPLIVEPK